MTTLEIAILIAVIILAIVVLVVLLGDRRAGGGIGELFDDIGDGFGDMDFVD